MQFAGARAAYDVHLPARAAAELCLVARSVESELADAVQRRADDDPVDVDVVVVDAVEQEVVGCLASARHMEAAVVLGRELGARRTRVSPASQQRQRQEHPLVEGQVAHPVAPDHRAQRCGLSLDQRGGVHHVNARPECFQHHFEPHVDTGADPHGDPCHRCGQPVGARPEVVSSRRQGREDECPVQRRWRAMLAAGFDVRCDNLGRHPAA